MVLNAASLGQVPGFNGKNHPKPCFGEGNGESCGLWHYLVKLRRGHRAGDNEMSLCERQRGVPR